jgi:hypothetical protein
MAGTRTAPTVDGTPVYLQVTLHWIDYNGDKRADSLNLPTATTSAEIEAIAAAAQALSNASLYDISVNNKYDSNEDSSNADEDVYNSVKDSLVIQTKEPTGQSLRGFIPSITQNVFVENTKEIDPTNADLATYLAALVAALPAGYEVIGARFTQRKQVNQQVKI